MHKLMYICCSPFFFYAFPISMAEIITNPLFLSMFSFFFILRIAARTPPLAPTPAPTPENIIINIEDLGAKPDGKTDISQAFLKAWSTACSSLEPTTIYVPPKEYLLNEIAFEGKSCKNSKDITFQINGTLIAPDYKKMDSSSDVWIKFNEVEGVTIIGGILDGQGSSLWECKLGQKQDCPVGSTTLGFFSSKNLTVQDLTSNNTKLFHVVVHKSTNIILDGIKINAPEDSPNTDGIHIQNSYDVRVLNTVIKTGDDCISIGPGTNKLWIQHVACGPGHGISIGSLAKGSDEEGVENVTVKNVVFTGTQNGLRIKAWARPSNGYVRGVFFQHAVMKNVQNPIIIDQEYCPGANEGCPDEHSGIQISEVTYTNIKGTSATKVAMKFDCSKTSPCEGIEVEDIKLTYENKEAQSFCKHARGITHGSVLPPSCL